VEPTRSTTEIVPDLETLGGRIGELKAELKDLVGARQYLLFEFLAAAEADGLVVNVSELARVSNMTRDGLHKIIREELRAMKARAAAQQAADQMAGAA
jgi:hypothetical protein